MGRRAAVIADFEAAVPESDPFREALYKIFVKKIKRMKKKAATDDNDDDEDEEEEEDEDEDEEEEDNDEKETCPTGCEQVHILLSLGCSPPRLHPIPLWTYSIHSFPP